MDREAILSADQRFRFSLTRRWEGRGYSRRGRVLWVMLNPSTADAFQDDPTIRKCVGFSQVWGYTELEVVNLYAYRATDPLELARAGYPVSPAHALPGGEEDNDAHILAAVKRSALVVTAWGQRGQKDRIQKVATAVLDHRPRTTFHLGLTKDGYPRHPLYLGYERQLQVFYRFRAEDKDA